MNKRFFAFLAAGGVLAAMTLGAAQAAEKDTMMKDKPAADMKAKPMADDKMKAKPMADDKMKARSKRNARGLAARPAAQASGSGPASSA